MGFRDIGCRFEGGSVVVEVIAAAICLEARLGDCPTWHQWHFPGDMELLIEHERAKGTQIGSHSQTH